MCDSLVEYSLSSVPGDLDKLVIHIMAFLFGWTIGGIGDIFHILIYFKVTHGLSV